MTSMYRALLCVAAVVQSLAEPHGLPMDGEVNIFSIQRSVEEHYDVRKK